MIISVAGILIFIYLCVAARLLIFHLFNDLSFHDSDVQAELGMSDERARYIRRILRRGYIAITILWPITFIIKPVDFVMMYVFSNRFAMHRVSDFYSAIINRFRSWWG